MNTNALKRFAKDARIKLLDLVGRKMEYVLSQDTAELRGKVEQVENLRKQIKLHGQSQVIEIVAYTWFNRFMALRFMDANGYTNPKIVTPAPGSTIPEILQEAKAGNIDAQLQFDRKRFNDLLDGKTSVADTQTEAYKLLLIATCNFWNTAIPFMFERISDYTELLLPDDLLSDFSIVNDIRNGMTDEDCKQEELIGWLYQFYIADKKDEVFAGLAKNQKITPENIPAATQLFTPRWIVRYMVENTLGKLWLTIKPDSKLREHMPYYIESPEGNESAPLQEGSLGIGDIRFLDPCVGSGHVLVYAFELFSKIYEEEGFNKDEIPTMILEYNLFGIDIDQRATQLAAFALTMKARSYYNRFFKKFMYPQVIDLENISEDILKESVSLPIQVNDKIIYDYKDLSLHLLTEAENFGSLIQINLVEAEAIQIQKGNIFELQQEKLKQQAEFLARKYHCVVTNPPYMGSGGMNDALKKYLEKHYPLGKTDLMTCFMERAMNLCLPSGYWGMINFPSWMFLGTFEKLRTKLIEHNKIDTMLHLGRGIFGSDFGSVTFTLQNRIPQSKEHGVYRRLFKEHVQVRSIEAIKELFFETAYGNFQTNQKNFEKIPGTPIGYWASDNDIRIFAKEKLVNEYADPRQGLATGDNTRFLRFYWEVENKKIGRNNKWIYCSKGGNFRRWYGNIELVINWENDGDEIKNFRDEKGKLRSRPQNSNYYFSKQGCTWSTLSAGKSSFRVFDKDWLFETKGSVCFPKDERMLFQVLAYLNSNLVNHFLKILSPTLDYHEGPIGRIPFKILESPDLNKTVDECIQISKKDWHSRETSWGFQQNELLKQQTTSINIAVEKYKDYWNIAFQELHKNEIALNQMFILLYELQDELTHEVPIDEVTILQEETKIIDNELYFEAVPILHQLISYSVGCIFGRYSINESGLVLANQGETLQDYLNQVPKPTFKPDEDNIIPFLEGEYFTDDVVGRFKEFIKAAFSPEHFKENLKFIEDTIGKDIRKYFVKDFYNDHIKRYKKRPIYWMFSSPKGSFKALIYMHRYRSDTISKLLNDYLRTYIAKLESEKQSSTQATISESASARERTLATKRITEIESILKELKEYERTLYELAMQKIEIDLDDGVKVNYQKFKSVLVPIKGLEKEEE